MGRATRCRLIGRTTLAELLRGREQVQVELQKLIDERRSLGRDGVVGRNARRGNPGALQDAMSRQHMAEREKQARISLGRPSLEIAHLVLRSGEVVSDNPTALHLRAMNMLYESLKEKGALMLIPSSALNQWHGVDAR